VNTTIKQTAPGIFEVWCAGWLLDVCTTLAEAVARVNSYQTPGTYLDPTDDGIDFLCRRYCLPDTSITSRA